MGRKVFRVPFEKKLNFSLDKNLKFSYFEENKEDQKMFSKPEFEKEFLQQLGYTLDLNEFELQFNAIRNSIPDFDIEYAGRFFDHDSNEYLWYLAMKGNRRSLSALYNKVKGLWEGSVPFDNSGLNLREDWLQIAAQKFSEVWMLYKPSDGYRFSTFIYTCVKRVWINEIKARNNISRKTDMNKIVESDTFNIDSVLIDAFNSYDDDMLIELFHQFGDEVKELDPETGHVYKCCMEAFSNTVDIDFIVKTSGYSRDTVEKCFKKIRALIKLFCERLNYGEVCYQ